MILDMGPMLRGETDHIHVDYLLTPDLPSGAEFEGDAHVVYTSTSSTELKDFIEIDSTFWPIIRDS